MTGEERRVLRARIDQARRERLHLLTLRKRQVLQCIADGYDTGETAAVLGLSVETVKTHLRDTYSRLGANDRAHAVAIGFRKGLIG